MAPHGLLSPTHPTAGASGTLASQVLPGRSLALPGRPVAAALAHPDDALAGVEGQPHQARPVDGHEAVPDAQLTRPLRRAPVHQVGDDHGGQDGAPARLHDGDAQDLPLLLPDANLGGTDGLRSPEHVVPAPARVLWAHSHP